MIGCGYTTVDGQLPSNPGERLKKDMGQSFLTHVTGTLRKLRKRARLTRTALSQKLKIPTSQPSQDDHRQATLEKLIHLLDRDYIRTRGTVAERLFYHQIAKALKHEIFEVRRKLGADYIASFQEKLIYPDFRIEPGQGIGIVPLKGYRPFDIAQAEARKTIVQREADELPSKGSLDYIASSQKDFDSGSAIAQLALDPNLIVPIIRYFGCLPVLFGFDINRASCREILKWSSHLYHRDPEDIMQIKVLIYLSDVDAETGPFTALPAELSHTVARQLNYRTGRLEDEEVYRIVGQGRENVCTGPQGTAIFCDTNRCFHYGGRIQGRSRYVLTVYYSLPTSTWFPLFPGDGERRNLAPLLCPLENHAFEQALLGLNWTVSELDDSLPNV